MALKNALQLLSVARSTHPVRRPAIRGISKTALEDPYLFQVAVVVAADLAQRVAAKLLEEGSGHGQGDHRLAYHPGRRDDRHIGALVGRDGRLAGWQVDRFQRPTERRDWLQIPTHHYLLAVGDAAFETAGLSAEEYGETVEQAVARKLAEAAEDEAERRLRASRHWRAGAVRALRDYEDAATNAGKQVETAMTNSLRAAEDDVARFAATGSFSFSRFANSVVADLSRIAARRAIIGPLASALGGIFGDLGGLFGSGFTGPAQVNIQGGIPVPHGGGRGSELTRRRYGVPPEAFAGAPRLHRGRLPGLRDAEIPAIIREDENVLTPSQLRAVAGGRGDIKVEVNVENRGTPQTYRVDRQFSAEESRHVVNLVADDLARGGDTARAVESRFGARPPAVT